MSISMNTYLCLANANLVLGIEKSGLELGFINNWELAKLDLILFLDLDNFVQKSIQDFALSSSLLLLNPSIVLFSPICLRSCILSFTSMFFSIKHSGAIIQL